MGEEFTGGFYVGYGKNIKCIKKFIVPNTLGGYYSTFTEFFGFDAALCLSNITKKNKKIVWSGIVNNKIKVGIGA